MQSTARPSAAAGGGESGDFQPQHGVVPVLPKPRNYTAPRDADARSVDDEPWIPEDRAERRRHNKAERSREVEVDDDWLAEDPGAHGLPPAPPPLSNERVAPRPARRAAPIPEPVTSKRARGRRRRAPEPEPVAPRLAPEPLPPRRGPRAVAAPEPIAPAPDSTPTGARIVSNPASRGPTLREPEVPARGSRAAAIQRLVPAPTGRATTPTRGDTPIDADVARAATRAPLPTGGRASLSQPERDLRDAWQLAFVVVVDEELATRAVTSALGDIPGQSAAPPTRLELLAATLRISLTRAADDPDRPSDSAVTTALWQLPAEQRAALWLAKVSELDTPSLATVLGLTTENAVHVASRAAEWLDVALDHESGPLCHYEGRLADFIEGELPDREAAELSAHLPDCPTCQSMVRAFAELSDLKAVLVNAVPAAPTQLAPDSVDGQERPPSTNGTATLDDSSVRIPALRPLAVCCALLLILGLIGISVVRPHKRTADPTTADQTSLVPGVTPTPIAGANLGVSSANAPAGSATTVVVTTTSVPAVTFPTVPNTVAKSKKTHH